MTLLESLVGYKRSMEITGGVFSVMLLWGAYWETRSFSYMEYVPMVYELGFFLVPLITAGYFFSGQFKKKSAMTSTLLVCWITAIPLLEKYSGSRHSGEEITAMVLCGLIFMIILSVIYAEKDIEHDVD